MEESSTDVTLTDLPPELLARVFTAIFDAAVPAPRSPVPYPSALDDEQAGGPPLVQSRGWAATAGAAGACRALRAGWVQAMRAVELDPAVGDWNDEPMEGGEAAYKAWQRVRAGRNACRAAGMAVMVGRLPALRSLRLRLDGMTDEGAVAAAGGLVAGLTAPGAPSLVALTIVVHRHVPVPAGLRAVVAAQPRLRHLVLATPGRYNVVDYNGVEPVAEAHAGAAEELLAVYGSLAPRLRSLDLQVIGPALGLHDDDGAAAAWLRRLPALPHVRFLGLDAPATVELLAAAARVCPAVTALSLRYATFEDDAEAAALVRHFPRLDRLTLACFDVDAAVSATFLAGVLRRVALHTLALHSLSGHSPPGSLAAAFRDAVALPTHLRHHCAVAPEEVAAFAAGGLPGVVALHLDSDVDVPAAAALGACASLRSLYLEYGDEPVCTRLSAAAAAALVSPGLEHLRLHNSGLGPAAATALFTAAARALPQALRSVTFTSCSGDVAAAVVAAAAVRSLQRLVMVDHLVTPRRSYGQKGPPVSEACAEHVALLRGWRSDVAFAEEL